MNTDDIISHKVAFLSGHSDQDLTLEMQAMVNKDQNLAQELRFIESFWQQNEMPEQKPSAAMDARFYQMLSQAQSTASAPVTEKSPSLVELLSSLFAPKYLMQFGAAALVFTLGFQMNSTPSQMPQDNVANLQTEVKSLSTLVALSMLQNSSASERLSGVSYVVNSDETNPVLSAKLVDMLNNDESTAVKLSVINALESRNSIKGLEKQLLDSIIQQDHTLVQIKLADLLLEKGTPATQSSIQSLVDEEKLSGDVVEYIQQRTKTQII